MAMLDLRQTDERGNYLPNPFWLRSGLITRAVDDTEAVLFSFPLIRGAITVVHCVAFELIEAFNGTSPSMLIGIGTIPLETTTTGGTVSVVDADEYFEASEITEATPGWYFPTTSDIFDMWAAGTPPTITHADSTVPVVYTTFTVTGSPTTGKGRLHMLISTIFTQ